MNLTPVSTPPSIPSKGDIYMDNSDNTLKYYNGTSWEDVAGSSSSNNTYSVGDFAHGGVVFWVDNTGQHGLVCTKEDLSVNPSDPTIGVRWHAGSFGNTQAKGDGVYAGKANTSIIIASHVSIGDDGSTNASRMCNEIEITESSITYGDWYLPSKEELYLMWLNRNAINTTAVSNGGSNFTTLWYWSSTESSNMAVEAQRFNSSGSQSASNKGNTCYVRAVRAF